MLSSVMLIPDKAYKEESMSQNMANLVDVRGVSFSRGSRPIFDNISLTVPRGKIHRHYGAVRHRQNNIVTRALSVGRSHRIAAKSCLMAKTCRGMTRSRLFTVRKRMSMLFPVWRVVYRHERFRQRRLPSARAYGICPKRCCIPPL